MKNYREIFKDLARTKDVTASHMVDYCIYRAMTAKNEKQVPLVNIADALLRKAFTPITRKIKLDNGREPYGRLVSILNIFKWRKDIIFLENDQERIVYDAIVKELLERYAPANLGNRKYFYVFVRQDISPEYQAVQACHVAAKMGSRNALTLKTFDELYITLVGVPNIAALEVAKKDIEELGFAAYEFREPDLNGELTAIASSPIKASDRKRLLSYKRLVFNG